MTMKLDEIDDLDEDLVDGENSQEVEVSENQINPDYSNESYEEDLLESESEDEDLIASLLKSKGINPSSVKFENEFGEIEEKDFNNLSVEEQLQILNFNEADEAYGLDNDEVELINQLRSKGISVQEYNNYIAQQAIQEYLRDAEYNQTYEVDSINDDELYLVDLKSRFPDISEEEALSELELAKSNESLYQKKINGIREEYKKQEDYIIKQREEEAAQNLQKQAQEFEGIIIKAITDNENIDMGESTLSLSVDDKNEIASFILDSDSTGVRYLSKALNDPNTLVKMVWYALKGEEAFNQINDYYKKQISEVAKNNYTKGYDEALSGKPRNGSKTVVKKTQSGKKRNYLSINDLD